VNGLLDTANSEYQASIASDKISAAIEYQDSRGFVTYADTLRNNISEPLTKKNPEAQKAIAGIAVAVGIGVLLFRWAIKINIRRFVQVMDVLLLLIVAGLVVSSLGHFDSAVHTLAQMDRKSQSLCFFYERFAKHPSCILGARVWDTAKILPDDKFPGILLSVMFGYTQNLYLVQAISYVVFLLTIGGIYFRSLTSRTGIPTKTTQST
jgi:high-affinity iron transporter